MYRGKMNSDDEESEFELTLHFPTYTKTAKIYQNLKVMLQGLVIDEDDHLFTPGG